MKTITLTAAGGTLTLNGTFNPFSLVGDERTLVYSIIDKMDDIRGEDQGKRMNARPWRNGGVMIRKVTAPGTRHRGIHRCGRQPKVRKRRAVPQALIKRGDGPWWILTITSSIIGPCIDWCKGRREAGYAGPESGL